METFGIVGMSFGVFGLIAFVHVQGVMKEMAELKEKLREAGILEAPGDDPKER